MKTIQGDTWDLISIRAYGSAEFIDDLITANPAHRMIAIFPAGVEVEVPKVDTTQAVTNLPPWKRRAIHG